MKHFKMIFVVGALLGATASLQGANAKDPQTATIMHGIFEALQGLLPMSLNNRVFTDPQNKNKILAQMDAMTSNVAVLQGHAETQNVAFMHISSQLRSDAERAREWFKNDGYEESSYYLHNLAENCMNCHSKLPAQGNFPGAQELLKAVDIEKLPMTEKVWLQVALRQFDTAVDNYEKLLLESKLEFEYLMALNTFADYLKVTIRVRDDFDRPLSLLDTMIERKDNSKASLAELKLMRAKVVEAKSTVQTTPGRLERARKLLTPIEKQVHRRELRRALPLYVAASAQLNRFMEEQPQNVGSLPEVYYWLGKAELALGHAEWISESDYFWEAAIRAAPDSTWAKKSYAALKELWNVTLPKSKKPLTPQEAKQRLQELAKLMESARSAPKRVQ